KAYVQNEGDKAAAAAKANPAPAQEVHVRAQSETSAKPIGLDDVLTGDYQQVPSQNGPASKPGAQSEASSTSTQKTNMPFTFYDRYTGGSQKPNSTSTSGAQSSSVETHESSWSDRQGQHKKNKKNKKKHHDDDQDQFDNVLIGDYQQVPSQSHSHSASDKTANSTYDGPPVLYNKPKPTSDRHTPLPTQWNKTASDAQGRFSVDFDGTKSSAQQTQTSHTS